MKDRFETLIEQLVAATCAPRGRFGAAATWPLLRARIRRQRQRRRLWAGIAAAASVALLCVAGRMAYEAARPVRMLTLTAQAGTRTVVLSDSTRVTLNRHSTLVYPERFGRDGRREVVLTGGAYFEVAKDRERPFVVDAGLMDVEVLGTRFNVEAYPDDDECRATLLQGAVSVSVEGMPEGLVLKPGERAIYDKEGGRLRQERLSRTDDEMSWAGGVLSFHDQPLEEIARRLENAYHTDIRIDSPQLSAYRLTASFGQGDTLEYILRLLQAAAGFEWERQGQTIMIRYKHT